ncbi:MAG: UDP-3-O-(3-hydroxymyristoyl)glucosamine N-acyltransferase [Candidatus Nitrotoga sp.]
MDRKSYQLDAIATQFGGQVLGDGTTLINQVATLESARTGHLAFLANNRYRAQLATTHAAAVIVGVADAESTLLPRIVCKNPYLYFAKVSAFLNPPQQLQPGIHASAVIGEGARIHPTVHIASHVEIGARVKIGAGSMIMSGCSIGADTVLGEYVLLYPRVVVYHNCVLGNRLIVHSGAIIGSDGFGLALDDDRWLKIPQIGRVIIGNDVEIGANTTIDRGALDDTVVGDGVKLDNQIQIAHNVRIGEHTVMAGASGIAGSAMVGRYCRIGGNAGILGHIQIADHVEISSHTMISKSIREPGVYTGIFPFSSAQAWRKNAAQIRHLNELVERIKTLEQELLKKES